MEQPRTITTLLAALLKDITGDTITVAQILDHLHERGFGFVLLLFALPAALPLPAVGVGTVLGPPLVLLTLQQMIGRRTLWLPEKFKARTLTRGALEKFISTAIPFLQKLEILIRPRLGFIMQGAFSSLIGICGFIMALSVCLPLPLTNTIPSFGIAVMALGVISRDGLAVIAGMVIGIAWVALLIAAFIIFGEQAADIIKEFIKDLL